MGSQDVVSEVLAGKRELHACQVAVLAMSFSVVAEIFPLDASFQYTRCAVFRGPSYVSTM